MANQASPKNIFNYFQKQVIIFLAETYPFYRKDLSKGVPAAKIKGIFQIIFENLQKH